MSEWIRAEDRLPEPELPQFPARYLVVVSRLYYPKVTLDSLDAPKREETVNFAIYDSKQKIWHVIFGTEFIVQLNALIDIDDAPLNSDVVTHWMPLPEAPKEE